MSKFQGIQPSGRDTGAELNLRRRFALMTQYVDLKDKYILDCGCGSGDYVIKFFEYSLHVRGVEYSAEKVAQFRSRACHPESVAEGDIEDLEFRDETFDVVLLNEVLEHVPNDRRALLEAYRVLKPYGSLVVFSPNRLYPFETHGTTLKLGRRRIPLYVPFVPYIPLWLGGRFLFYQARNYFPWELAAMIEGAGFQTVKQAAVWQTFENISGSSPRIIRVVSPVLRAASFTLEKIPVVRCFGVSQVIFAVKPVASINPLRTVTSGQRSALRRGQRSSGANLWRRLTGTGARPGGGHDELRFTKGCLGSALGGGGP